MTDAPIETQHLGGDHVAEIRVSPAAEAGYRALTADSVLPEGSVVVEWLRDASTGKEGPVFALERSAAGWAYWVLDRQGRPEQRGEREPCAGCHAGAPAAPIFGNRRAPQESTRPVPRSPE